MLVVEKGWRAGMGNKEGAGKLAVNGFERTAQSLRLPSVNPKGLKIFPLSFTVSVYAAGGLEAGRKKANGDEPRRAAAAVCPAVYLRGPRIRR